MNDDQIHCVMAALRQEYPTWRKPAVTVVSECVRSPFRVLVSCLISLRTRDEVTAAASARLFARADTPQRMVELDAEEIGALIYPAGFYRTKSVQILELARRLVAEHGGEVPDDLDQLLEFRGVGRKTANLVVALGFGKPAICVDTHVHRICNRLGYVTTASPMETEMVLRAQLPDEYWIEINELLVAFGQNQCHPLSPRCSTCPVARFCARIGVKRCR